SAPSSRHRPLFHQGEGLLPPAKPARTWWPPAYQSCWPSNEPVNQIFEIFLPPRSRPRIDPLGLHPRRDVLERPLAPEHRLCLGAFPSGIALVEKRVIASVLDDCRRRFQPARADIHRPNMPMQKVFRIDRLPAQFRVEIGPAG